MSNVSALSTIMIQQMSYNKDIVECKPREEDPMTGNPLSVELCTYEDGSQGFCWVDSDGGIKGYFGYEFLLGILDSKGVSIEEFCEDRGWKLNETLQCT